MSASTRHGPPALDPGVPDPVAADPVAADRTRAAATMLALAAGLGVAAVWSLAAGAETATPLRAAWNSLFGLDGPRDDFGVLELRLPRTLLALLAGSALALSGAIIQALLRNALASPKIIGVNSGAALAVCLAVAFGLPAQLTPLLAIAGGLGAATFVYLGTLWKQASPARLALVGIAVGSVCDAGVDALLVTAPDYRFSRPLIWMTGSLHGRTWSDVQATAPLLIPLAIVALALSFRLDLLRLGDRHALGLGVEVSWERPLLLLLATALASVAIAAVGTLGFVGLMAPHMARQLVGGGHRALMPVAMLTGMLLVVLADAAGRAMPLEVSAGILTALFGAPFFIWILLRTPAGGES
ncbi:MAG: iron ABC transporter permease [Acidobacteriota bacterium]